MKVVEMKRKRFYTDNEKIYWIEGTKKDLYTFTERCEDNELFLKDGIRAVRAGGWNFDKSTLNLREVEAGEVFQNGDVKILDKKSAEIFSLKRKNLKYDESGYVVNKNEVKYEEYFRIYSI